MSLATRCPACSTVFRVVQDQLRVSEGWVRCGQCQEVFNALEALFDLDTEPAALASAPPPPPSPSSPPPPLPPPAPPPRAQAPAPAAPPSSAAAERAEPVGPADDAELADWAEEPRPEDHWAPGDPGTLPMSLEALAASYRAAQQADVAPVDDAAAPPPAAPVAPPAEPDDEQAPTPSRFMGPVPDWARSPAPRDRRKKASRRATAAAEAHAQPHRSPGAQRKRRKPEFVRQAERAAQWQRPMVRVVLGLAATVLAAMLGGQVAHNHRDMLAARAPALAPALQAGCAWLGCRIEAPRALQRLRLDASDLTRTEQAQVLRFVADLHNTADHTVRAPALDLSFTDAAGQVVARKVLLPADLGPQTTLAAEGQWRVDARLAVGDLRVAGYSVEVFYP